MDTCACIRLFLFDNLHVIIIDRPFFTSYTVSYFLSASSSGLVDCFPSASFALPNAEHAFCLDQSAERFNLWLRSAQCLFQGSICELAMPWLRSAQRLFQGSICMLAMPWLRSAQRLFQGSTSELTVPWLRSAQRLFQGSTSELTVPWLRSAQRNVSGFHLWVSHALT